ncbi:c-type cytochrome biogenesis protein CcmI [Chelativorans sp. YIM 93263]|uniref:c-type cytochrome biogenesis protein CcmI n=1 Tax=Chelativorans sp. YIM 93263 TaxID=2906648 RepID=UPI00237864FB|nr:c-type cytochrome biogenesis protein CcmI [Chelativorans sp. YIM 93263]
MVFWIIAALFTLAASYAVIQPFVRGSRTRTQSVEHDLAVYRDQLAELEREVKQGIVPERDAEEARAEIARRMLRLKDAADEETARQDGKSRTAVKVIAAAAILAVPVLSWGGYLLLGSPGMPSMPLQARLQQDPSRASLEELLARAENHLSANPDDARGWETLAPVYARIGRYDDAATAYRNSIELEGATAERESALGEVLVGAAGGVVTAEAEAAFQRALDLDEGNPRARFYTAMGSAQEGDVDRARAIWEAMVTELPDDSPWKQAAGQAAEGLAPAVTNQEDVGPTREQQAAAQEMMPEEQREMIEGMVSGLDARLRENPDDPEGWRRLLRSYVVLGRRDDAEEALSRAFAALGPDSEDAEALAEYANGLGLTER